MLGALKSKKNVELRIGAVDLLGYSSAVFEKSIIAAFFYFIELSHIQANYVGYLVKFVLHNDNIGVC